nr:putative reverse transcriptase domain-containing protein [Tanacetum cinerariifolium]
MTVGIDWLSKLKAKKVCFEKILQTLLSNREILEVHVERPRGNQKQLKTMKVNELKLEDIPVVCDFPVVFPKDLSDLMNCVCKPNLDKFVIVFIDDILIYSKFKEEHEVHPKLILELLETEKLLGKFSKCEFWLHEVHLLEHLMNSKGIHVDPIKIEAVKNWKLSKTPTDFYSLLGLRNNVIAYVSKQLKIYEKNYTTDDLELGTLRRWIELFSDYDCEIRYHAGKANIVADALSRKECMKPRRARAMSMTIHSSIKAKIIEAQSEASKKVNTLSFHITILAIAIESFRNTTGFEYCLPSLDRWSKKSRTPIAWAEVGESKLIRPEIVHETTNTIVQIKERLKAARDHQESYADNRRKPLEFKVRNKVLLKVSPWKGVVRFGKRSKLSSRYVGPFDIVERVGPIAYRLRIPQELIGIHDTFYMSNPKEYQAYVILHLPLEEIKIDNRLRFVEEPIEIIDYEVKQQNLSLILIVKVRWNSRRGPEFSWEREDEMKRKHLQLFASAMAQDEQLKFRDDISL